MLTITLPPELESVVTKQAQDKGVTPELFLLDDLLKRYVPVPLPEPSADAEPIEEETMADFFADYIGAVNSSNVAPGGSDLSENAGRKFKELMAQKHREGKV